MTPLVLPAMVAAYLLGGAGALLARSPRAARLLTAAGACAGALMAMLVGGDVLLSGTPVEWTAPALVEAAGGIAMRVDALGAVFLALVGGIGAAAAIYGVSYTAAFDGRRSLRLFGVMFTGFLAGMSVVPCAANVFTFLLAWEVMAITSYFLVMTEHEDEDTRAAGLWYAAMTHAGFLLLVPMFLLLAPSPSATSFADLRIGAAALPSGMRAAVFLLALAAFGAKAGVVPLHVWLPRAHPAAPSHVSALMSGVMIKLGIYGLLRVVVDFLGGGPAWWGGLVLVVGSLSALGGVLYALTENDLKRLLAYSSVENVGVILLGIGAGLVLDTYGLHALAVAGFAAALLHVVNHGSFKALLFLSAGNVVHATGTRSMEQLGGLVKRMPHTAVAFLVGALAAAALPPLNGFASEWLVFQALLSGAHIPSPEIAIGTPLAVGVLALTSGLAAVAFVKAFGISFLALPRSDRAAAAHEAAASARVVLAVLAAGCVVLGLVAPSVLRGLTGTVAALSRSPVEAVAGSRVWLTTPAGLARVSPVFLSLLIAAVVVASAAAVRARGLAIRRADTWGCGRIRQTARMEYTSSAFAEPLRRIFAELYRPTEDLSISSHPDSPYFVRAITYTTRVAPWVESALYGPVVRAARTTSTTVRRLQAGSVHAYLLYVAAALVAALAAGWWYR